MESQHTDLFPTIKRNAFLEIYKTAGEERAHWRRTLEQGNDYWSELLGVEDKPFTSKDEQPYHPESLNCAILDTGNVAVIKIRSFDTFQIEQDIERIEQFLPTIEDYPHLIIDIQDNEGGDSHYWKDHLVPLLSHEDQEYNALYAIRKSDFLKTYFSTIDLKKEKFKSLQHLPALPPELNAKDFDFWSESITIKGKRTRPYQGKIYLLVNKGVFSSAEGLAVFCKSSHWATVVGEVTAGDGAGSIDAVIQMLPNSKIMFRYTGELALNPDGSSNTQMKTTPDIVMEGKDSEDRLQNFVKTLTATVN
ncbi:S41 family peptidase [Persicobacter sp. CCB-QB2]|uniref:S41 family peptidase n=1 Tax=Persicobacter sp. CCB-QB2 TaxID=1561025 RepID=UPI0006A9E91F|nr:S41 family peptidase [Persicobacter sp. CCB-QB2]